MTLYNMSFNRFLKCERSLQIYLIATFQVSGRGLTECLFHTLDFKMIFIKRDNSQTNPVHGDTLINMNISSETRRDGDLSSSVNRPDLLYHTRLFIYSSNHNSINQLLITYPSRPAPNQKI